MGKLVREGSAGLKQEFEKLISGRSIRASIDEQIVYGEPDGGEEDIWSLLLAGGYLKVLRYEGFDEVNENTDPVYELCLTNREVRQMFRTMVKSWFRKARRKYNGFIKALLEDDVKVMNHYMNQVALTTFRSFDTGNKPSEAAKPERFYHGFVLELLVELADRYTALAGMMSCWSQKQEAME